MDAESVEDYEKVGFGRSTEFGDRPAVLVVDMCKAYFEDGSPLNLDRPEVAVVGKDLVATARSAGVPVVWTRVEYEPGGANGGVWYRKIGVLSSFDRGNPLGDWLEGIEPEPDDVVVTKQHASGFFGTDLADRLTELGVDTVLVAGVSTSGCVRATATDASAAGFLPFVVREAVGDRTKHIEDANLFDLHAKYADVVAMSDVAIYLESLGSGGARLSQQNWAGNHRYPSNPLQPGSEDELASLIAGAAAAGRTVGLVGARHSFSPVADGDVMVDLGALPERFEISPDRGSVRVNASMSYARFAELAKPEGLALANLASVPHVSVAGATTTGTHGSGSGNGCLATSVRSLTLIGGDGVVRRVDGPDALAPLVVGLGVTGCCIEVELDVELVYQVEQRVFDGLPVSTFMENFDAIMDSGYSVSAFTRWSSAIDHVWIKHRVEDQDRSPLLVELGAVPASAARHPVGVLPGDVCTEQFGRPGLWSERLPHFLPDAMPNAGDEIQTEYFVPRADGAAAVAALQAIGSDLDRHLMVSEIRTVAADQIWMSPFYRRDSVGFHFTWNPGQKDAERAAAMVANALAPFDPRPHWGKVFSPDPAILDRYPMARRFLAEMVDPVFANTWLERTLATA